MILTDQERDKFAEYLLSSAKSDELLIKQMHDMGGMEPLIKARTAEMHAQRIVVQLLQRTHRG